MTPPEPEHRITLETARKYNDLIYIRNKKKQWHLRNGKSDG